MGLDLLDPALVGVAGAVAGIDGWKELDREILTGTSDTITVSGLDDKLYYMILSNVIGSGNVANGMRLGDSGGIATSGYAWRYQYQDETDATATSSAYIFDGNSFSSNTQSLRVGWISNGADQEKSTNTMFTYQRPAGASTAPANGQGSGKATFTDPITDIQLYQFDDGDFAADSELVVLGYDPDDSASGGFWEQLGTNTLTGDSAACDVTLSSSKKYLWFEAYGLQDLINGMAITVNTDENNNYAYRYIANGGSSSSATSRALAIQNDGDTPYGWYLTGFILNVEDQEKLFIMQDMETRGATSTAPDLTSVISASKWVNTDDLIDTVSLTNQGGNDLHEHTSLTVWGSD